MRHQRLFALVQVMVLSTAVACTPAAAPAALVTPPTPSGLGAARSPRLAAIVEPTVAAGVYPRKVRDVNGEVTIPHKPSRIHTLSVGYDEITLRLVDPARLVAVGTVTANVDFSNVATEASRVPNKVGRNSEQILALNPDLVVSSPFASRDLLKQLQDAKVPLIIADLVSSVDAHEENIRFLAYVYGEEEKGESLVREVQGRIARLSAVASKRPREQWPRAIVLSGGQTVDAAGSGTTEGGILELAGARNAAAEAGVVGNKDFALEALADLKPDFLVVTEANPDQPSLVPRLREHPVVGSLSAFHENRVLVIKSSLMTTLSHWNLVGAEQLARAFHPGEQP
jgi:iron complex transport system substrate-binding protein